MLEKSTLVRVVKSPEGDSFAVDDTGKSPGRGAYICKSVECLAKVSKSRGFDRSLKTKVPAEIYIQVEEAPKNHE